MKASVYHQYGSPEVLHFEEVTKPTPKDNEILVKIHSTSVSSADWRARSLKLDGFSPVGRLVFGLLGPRQKILGTELAGKIESVGNLVTRFCTGDEIYAATGAQFGCHAEYRTLSEDDAIAHKPARLGFEAAAAISFGGLTALEFLRDKAGISSGNRVLINGASGAVGLAAIQLAKHFGAQVTGVCSTHNLELVKSMGADHVIDYTCEDFTKNGRTYDIILDTVATAHWARCKGSLAQSGRLVLVNGLIRDMVRSMFQSKKGKRIVSGVSGSDPASLAYLNKLIEANEYTPVVERVYPFDEIAAAHAYVDTGRKSGSVVINIVSQHKARTGPEV